MQAPGQVQRGSGEGLGGFGRARSGSAGFRRRFQTRPESLGAKPSQVQQGSGEGSGEGSREGLGGFGAETVQVPAKVPEALLQSQVRFNRVAEFGAEPGDVQQGSSSGDKVWEFLVQSLVRLNRRFRESSRKPWCKAK